MNETLDKSAIAMKEMINLSVFLISAEKYVKAHMGKLECRGWVKKKYTDVFKSGGNILGQSASKCWNRLFIIR